MPSVFSAPDPLGSPLFRLGLMHSEHIGSFQCGSHEPSPRAGGQPSVLLANEGFVPCLRLPLEAISTIRGWGPA